jgi:hypothetical protein
MATKRGKEVCLHCRFLELKKDESGEAIYWCLTKKFVIGSTVLGRPACTEYRVERRRGLRYNK